MRFSALVSFVFICAMVAQNTSKAALFDPKLVDVFLTPANIKQGDSITLVINVRTQYDSADKVRIILDASVDALPVSLSRATESSWSAKLGPYLDVASHKMVVDVFIEDKAEGDLLRFEITNLNQQIAELETELRNEDDPAIRISLQNALDQKTVEKTEKSRY